MENTSIITIYEEQGDFSVNGRELNEKLGINTRYNDWFRRMCEYGFEEEKDFQSITQKRVTAQGNETSYSNHQLSLSMAKELCMLQRTEQGRTIRRYLISIEEAWNTPEKVLARALCEHKNQPGGTPSRLILFRHSSSTIIQFVPFCMNWSITRFLRLFSFRQYTQSSLALAICPSRKSVVRWCSARIVSIS